MEIDTTARPDWAPPGVGKGVNMPDTLQRAREGDSAAFEELVEPYRRELQIHAYRMLGSLADAEDCLQESLFAAWRSVARFEGRASVRTWLYRITTNRSLNMLRSKDRHPTASLPGGVAPPEPTRLGEVTWLQPYPDALLDPSDQYERREAILGGELVGRCFETVAFRDRRRYRLIPTRANYQPAYGTYLLDPVTGLWRAFGLLVFTVCGGRVTAIDRFDNDVLERFGLPRTL